MSRKYQKYLLDESESKQHSYYSQLEKQTLSFARETNGLNQDSPFDDQ